METLEQLVKERRGYKYLYKDGTSPYQNYKYNLKSKKTLVTTLDIDINKECAEGWNLATLKWIADNCMILDGVIVEYSIPKKAQIIVPKNSTGKFRTNIIKPIKIHKIDSLFPILEDLKKRLDLYKPINPIQAEVMPDKTKIKKIMNQVGDQVGNQVWNHVGDQVWDQVGDQVWDQVRDQVRNQVGICAYYAVKEFYNLDYDHPVFELIRLGIMVVNIYGKFKIFGKNGNYLGEIDA